MRKITISIEENVYEGLHSHVGQGKISHFINELVKPYIIGAELDKAYQAMAQDEIREKAADDWTEGLAGDVNPMNLEDEAKWS